MKTKVWNSISAELVEKKGIGSDSSQTEMQEFEKERERDL